MASEPTPYTRQPHGVGVQHFPGTDPGEGRGTVTKRMSNIRLPRAHLLSFQRRMTGWLILIIGLPVLLGVLSLVRPHPRVVVSLLLTLALTVVVAAVGGLAPGLTGAVIAAGAVNWWFIPPYRTLDIHDAGDTVSIVVFVGVGVVVATLVDRVSVGAATAEMSRSDAQALARMATAVATEVDPMPALMDEARTALHLEAVSLFERAADGGWLLLATSGEHPPSRIADGVAHPVDDVASRVLVLHGRQLNSNDVSLLEGIADQIAVALDAVSLRRDAATAAVLEQVDQLRTSILHAVSHDLRTPLTAIKASATSLLSPEVQFGPEDTHAMLTTIDSSVDRLDRVVGDLLDMSRLQSGVIPISIEPTPIVDVIHAAAASVGMATGRYRVNDDQPGVTALIDGALMERAIGNVLSNASLVQPDQPIEVSVTANPTDRTVCVSVIDHGPGIPEDLREEAVTPFHRLGDRSSAGGVGLGLAIANGLSAANGGQMSLSGTPGGGLTVTFELPAAPEGTDS